MGIFLVHNGFQKEYGLPEAAYTGSERFIKNIQDVFVQYFYFIHNDNASGLLLTHS
jgi:hypothetical protein